MNAHPEPQRKGPPQGWAASSLKDAEIIDLVLAGNSAAFEAIMRRYNRLLFRLARGIVDNDADASDVLQESYVRAYFRLAQFNGPDGFPSWMSRIVINEALSRRRGKSLPFTDAVDTESLPDRTRHQPEQAAMNRDALELIETAIAGLPPDFRVVFMLRGIEGLSVREVSGLLDLNPATVKTRFHRARSMMKESLGQTIEDAIPGTFAFAGHRCDNVVTRVFRKLAGIEQAHRAPGRE